jgi:hypothetical protein
MALYCTFPYHSNRQVPVKVGLEHRKDFVPTQKQFMSLLRTYQGSIMLYSENLPKIRDKILEIFPRCPTSLRMVFAGLVQMIYEKQPNQEFGKQLLKDLMTTCYHEDEVDESWLDEPCSFVVFEAEKDIQPVSLLSKEATLADVLRQIVPLGDGQPWPNVSSRGRRRKPPISIVSHRMSSA